MDREFLDKLRKALKEYSSRDFALNGATFTVTPHRMNDGKDGEDDWCFKVLSYVRGELVDSYLL
jgi:hypothetical protein